MAQNAEALKENLGPDLTSDAVAHIVNVSDRAVRLWVEQGRIPSRFYYRLPGDTHLRFKPELIDWLRSNEKAV